MISSYLKYALLHMNFYRAYISPHDSCYKWLILNLREFWRTWILDAHEFFYIECPYFNVCEFFTLIFRSPIFITFTFGLHTSAYVRFQCMLLLINSVWVCMWAYILLNIFNTCELFTCIWNAHHFFQVSYLLM